MRNDHNEKHEINLEHPLTPGSWDIGYKILETGIIFLMRFEIEKTVTLKDTLKIVNLENAKIVSAMRCR
jgi:hypothetical protein